MHTQWVCIKRQRCLFILIPEDKYCGLILAGLLADRSSFKHLPDFSVVYAYRHDLQLLGQLCLSQIPYYASMKHQAKHKHYDIVF